MRYSTTTPACVVLAVVLHAAGALLAWTTYLTLPADLPVADRIAQLAGQRVIERLAGAAPVAEQPAPPLEEYKPPETRVLITPSRAQIAERTFVPASTDVSRPTPRELALVDRILRAPPAAMDRPADSEAVPARIGSPTAFPVPRRHPSLKVAVAKVAAAGSSPQTPSVGWDHETLPRLLENRPPAYPAQALMARQQGTVVLRVLVEPTGGVGKIEVLQSSGHEVLDAEAVGAVRTWRFIPATRAGRPVPCAVRLPVRFTLE